MGDFSTPFGLRQVKIVPLSDAGVEIADAAVFLPAGRTFSFAETEEFETLQGGDRTVASHGNGPTVGWELEGGGISLDAWKALSGGIVTKTGTGATTVTKFTKKTSHSRPYFNVYGRAISDSGGDFHMVVYRCKADGDLEASLENGSFLLTAASGTGFGNETTEDLYDFVSNDTVKPLTLATTP